MAKLSAVDLRNTMITGMIGLLGALAFGLAVESAKDSATAELGKSLYQAAAPWPIPGTPLYLPWSTAALAIAFYCCGLNFVLGTSWFMAQEAEKAGKGGRTWMVDARSTIYTLTLLVILGALATVTTAGGFFIALFGQHLYQVVWSIYRRFKRFGKDRLTTTPVPWVVSNAFGCAATAAAFLLWNAGSKGSAVACVAITEFGAMLWTFRLCLWGEEVGVKEGEWDMGA